MITRFHCTFALLALLVAACSAEPYQRVDYPAQPTLLGATASGTLVVLTPTQDYEGVNGESYACHTGYSLLDADGRFIRSIPNRIDNEDETATKLRLATGDYFVRAQSAMGNVEVAVQVEAEHLTELVLTQKAPIRRVAVH